MAAGPQRVSYQDPGFIDHVVNKKAEIIRVYLPPDANTLLATVDHCLRSRQYVNVIVAGKQASMTYLSMDEARLHCSRGPGLWEWASNDDGNPDVVLGCCGDTPTLEIPGGGRHPPRAVAATPGAGRQRGRPDAPPGAERDPHGLSDDEFDGLFTTDKPIVFAYHGYPGSSIASCTVATTTTTCTCAATRRRAPPRPRSTW